jgi:TIR domain
MREEQMMNEDSIPLKPLIVDADEATRSLLEFALRGQLQPSEHIALAATLDQAQEFITAGDIRSIFIDPLTLGLEESTEWVFSIRNAHPQIVFVLFLDMSIVARGLVGFYSGSRQRFKKYYKIDKGVPATGFPSEVESAIRRCRSYLSYSLSNEQLDALDQRLSAISAAGSDSVDKVDADILEEIRAGLKELRENAQARHGQPKARPGSVFLSYRFADKEMIEGLVELLENEGFEVLTGRDAPTYISQAILDRIQAAEFFLCVMTAHRETADKSFITSPWLLEEKGAALAFGKPVVLMVGEDVEEYGGLEGDWQRISFTERSFTKAALKAIKQLRALSGETNVSNHPQRTGYTRR